MNIRISDKYPTYSDFWNEYRTAFLEFHKDLVVRAVAAYILHTLYYYWRDSRYEPEKGVFYGKFFSKATQDAINYTRNQEIYQNVFKTIKLTDKEFFKTISKTEYSKENQRIKQGPKTTEQTNIPYTLGSNMLGGSYGRAQLLKTKTYQKENTKEITKGRRIANEDGTIEYKPTFTETTNWGDKKWLGRLFGALQYLKFDFNPKSYQFLFNRLFAASGYLITLPSGRKKWISTVAEEEEEDQLIPERKPRPKKVTDDSEITWEEWKDVCAKQEPIIIPSQDNFYLEQITRYLKRKEKERAPIGSLTALGIEKQKELPAGLIKAWEKPLNVPELANFNQVMNQVVGYNEFKDKMLIYLVNLAKDLQQGKKTEQTIYVLLGPPGIGKSFIAEKLAEAMERPLINIDLGGRKDTGILDGVGPATKMAYAGRICQRISESKNRGGIILLDEFEKVADEGLANILGNVLDIKKNQDWFDQFLGYRVDISNCILLCTANYANKVPDFVQNRAEMVNIELATYQQKVDYVIKQLGRKLNSDADTAHYVSQIHQPANISEDTIITNLLVILDDLKDQAEGEEKENLKKIIKSLNEPTLTSQEKYQLIHTDYWTIAKINQLLKRWKKLLKTPQDLTKYIIVEEWGYRQINANIENIFKTVRAYASAEINKPIADLTKWAKLEQSSTRWTFTYQQGQKLILIRIRTENEQKQSVLSPELNLNWPLHAGFTKPKIVITK